MHPLDGLLQYALAAAAFAAVVIVGVREHRMLRTSRRNLLDGCRDTLEDGRIRHGHDDFPGLTGKWHGRDVHVRLIPDTMTIRRLPQLWLSVTLMTPMPRRGGFAALVRHTGYEFYGMISHFEQRLEPPPGLPPEIVIRGQDSTAQGLLDAMAVPLAEIFSDPHVKEIAITAKGLRIIRQAGEGRRGEHLLLRQAIFDGAEVTEDDVRKALSQLDALRDAIRIETGAHAA